MGLRVPHLYDMHSSLPQQLSNFAFSRSRLIKSVFLAIERFMIRRSRVVIVICPSLEDTVKAIEPGAQTVLIENAPGSAEDEATPEAAAAVRRSLNLAEGTPIVLYTGTFEAYQGLDLLFAAMAIVRRARPDARLVLAGGRADQVDARASRRARPASTRSTIFAGERPASEIPAYLLAADVLVSPRSRGTNTPLKIYQYLRSGKPIVATRLLTHTQVLSDETAILTEATPQAFADGILAGLDDPARPPRRPPARELAETKYSYEAYLERTRQACAALMPTRAATGAASRTWRDRAPPSDALQLLACTRIPTWPAPSTSDASADRSADLVQRAQARVLANMVGRIQDRRILDVGTGTGRVALLLAHGAAKVTAVDASEEMLAIASRRAADELVKVKFQLGDAHHLDFPDRDFDAVVAFSPADAHAGVEPLPRGNVPRVRPAGHHRLPSATSFRAPRVDGAAGGANQRSADRGVPGLHAAHDRGAFERTATASARCTASSCCRSRFHKSSARAASRSGRDVLDRIGLLKPFGSPVTLVAERCAS
jgi:protein-L-isoaspartate O-methyltransferase